MKKNKVSNNRLIKSLLISGLFILILIILSLFYLSNYGIKTSKFNKLILDRLIEVDSRISAEIEDVFLKLNLGKKEIKIITKNTNLYLEKNLIKLSEINLDIDLLSFLNNKAAIKNGHLNSVVSTFILFDFSLTNSNIPSISSLSKIFP